MNMTGAAAVCIEAGVPEDKVYSSLSNYVLSKDRYNETEFEGRRVFTILSKNQNPVSFDQSISQMLVNDNTKSCVIYVNNINHTNNKDTTWLYDIAFERLLGKVSSIIAVGPRGYDLAVRLKFGGFDPDRVIVCNERNLKQAAQKTKGDLYLLTEIYDAGKVAEALK